MAVPNTIAKIEHVTNTARNRFRFMTNTPLPDVLDNESPDSGVAEGCAKHSIAHNHCQQPFSSLQMAHSDHLAAPLVLSSPDNPLVPIGGFPGLRDTAQLIREKLLVRNTSIVGTESSY